MISFFKAAVNHMDEEKADQPRSPQTLDHGIADTVLGFESEQQAGHPKEASKLLNKSDRLAQEVRPRHHNLPQSMHYQGPRFHASQKGSSWT